jgi:hypothetical protein
MKSYNQFINEEHGTKISIQDVYDTIKEIFDKDDVLSTDSVYDSVDGDLRLIISVSKLYSSNQIVIYTKFLFKVDEQKKYLTSNTFKYLYEINCQFEEVSFDGINDLKNKITELINSDKFGDDVKKLSEFLKKPEHEINQWFYKNDIKDISVTGFKYDPEMKNVPCKELSFKFTMTINDQDDTEMTIQKIGINRFKLTFKMFNKSFSVEKSDLNLVQIIGQTLRDKYKK